MNDEIELIKRDLARLSERQFQHSIKLAEFADTLNMFAKLSSILAIIVACVTVVMVVTHGTS